MASHGRAVGSAGHWQGGIAQTVSAYGKQIQHSYGHGEPRPLFNTKGGVAAETAARRPAWQVRRNVSNIPCGPDAASCYARRRSLLAERGSAANCR